MRGPTVAGSGMSVGFGPLAHLEMVVVPKLSAIEAFPIDPNFFLAAAMACASATLFGFAFRFV